MSDNRSEFVDEDKLDGEYPPEEPLGVAERLTGVEEQSGESFGHRVAREDRGDDEPDDRGIGQLIRPDGDQFVDGEADEVAIDLRDDDDESTVPAEEAAMHLTAAPPMHDSDGYVDD